MRIHFCDFTLLCCCASSKPLPVILLLELTLVATIGCRFDLPCIAISVHVGIVSGQQLRNAISARSNFGLGFALTHIVIKSDESHRRKYIFDLTVADLTSLPHISIATLGIDSCPLSW